MCPNTSFVYKQALYIVISVVLGSKFRSLRKRPTALLTLANTLLR